MNRRGELGEDRTRHTMMFILFRRMARTSPTRGWYVQTCWTWLAWNIEKQHTHDTLRKKYETTHLCRRLRAIILCTNAMAQIDGKRL